MFKGILFFLLCVSLSSFARVSYPPEINPYKDFEKTIARLSKKEKTELLAKIYHFMLKREEIQPLAIAWNEDPEHVPDWLDTLLWETSYAQKKSVSTPKDVRDCMKENAARTRTVGGKTYPSTCMYAGNLICTTATGIKPRCTQQYLPEELKCPTGPGVLCQPDSIINCNDNVKTPKCADIEKLKKAPHVSTRGPAITRDCLGIPPNANETEAEEIIKKRAAEAMPCIEDFDKITKLLENMGTFCRSIEKERTGDSDDRKDFAGNDRDCKEMEAYLNLLKKPELPGRPPTEEISNEKACRTGQGFTTLCEGQDKGSMCEPKHYVPANTQTGECLNVSVTQKGSPQQVIPVCHEDLKRRTENPGLAWLQRKAREDIDWNKLGRVKSWDDRGHSLTQRDGIVEFCLDEDTQTFIPRGKFKTKYFKKYIEDVVTNEEQLKQIDKVFDSCSAKALKELADQKIAPSDWEKSQSIWAMVKVADTENKYLSTRRTTGHAIPGTNPAEAICSPAAPCTESTFICAKIDKSGKIKDKEVADYFTLYTDKMSASRRGTRRGDLQFFERGSFENPNATSHKDRYGKWPHGISVFDANEDNAFLTLSEPQPLKNERRMARDRVESVVYRATERLCTNEVTSFRPNNKVIARMTPDGREVERMLICDATTGDPNNFNVWLDLKAAGIEIPSSGPVALKGLKAWDKDTSSTKSFDLGFNRGEEVGSCMFKWEGADTPSILEFQEHAKIREIKPRESIVPSRAPRSTGKPKEVKL